MSVRAAPSSLHRVKRVAAFFAIVWGVAASFVLFDMLFVFGAGRLIQSGGPFEALDVPSALQHSEVCGVAAGDAHASGRASTVVRARAWALGSPRRLGPIQSRSSGSITIQRASLTP
jgi:hypothetical protein